jgi:hypothetical protein
MPIVPTVEVHRRVAKQLFAAVGRATRQARTQTLCAGGEQEVLHRRKDRPAEQQLGGHWKALLRKQYRREFACAVVQFVGGAVVVRKEPTPGLLVDAPHHAEGVPSRIAEHSEQTDLR